MVIYYFKGKGRYIDRRLKEKLDRTVIPDLQKRDKDVVIIVDGGERKGKSVFAQTLAAYIASKLNSPFTLSNICMTPDEWRSKVSKSRKNEVIIYDEAHRGMGSGGALSEINRILRDLMMEMGQKNLCNIVVLPTFFMLEKYVALFRARGLFHIYESKNKRGYWVYFNEKKKLNLYIKGKKEFNYNCMRWPRFRGRFHNQYAVSEKAYREKKANSFKQKPRYTKAEVYIKQRNKLIYALHKEYKLSIYKIENLFKKYGIQLKKSSISEILSKFRGDVP